MVVSEGGSKDMGFEDSTYIFSLFYIFFGLVSPLNGRITLRITVHLELFNRT